MSQSGGAELLPQPLFPGPCCNSRARLPQGNLGFGQRPEVVRRTSALGRTLFGNRGEPLNLPADGGSAMADFHADDCRARQAGRKHDEISSLVDDVKSTLSGLRQRAATSKRCGSIIRSCLACHNMTGDKQHQRLQGVYHAAMAEPPQRRPARKGHRARTR